MAYPLGSPTCWNASNINCMVHDAQCSYGCVQNAAEEIAAMSQFNNLRLYQNAGGGSPAPQTESANSGWMTPAKMGGRFSAMCWFFGRDLYTALEAAGEPRPIGLIETNVGGTPDQHWSSPDALAKCKGLPGNPSWEWKSNFTDSVLWNGKVVPLLRNTIKGAIWMQGEANSHADGRQYNCSFPAMIEDWRAKWAEGTGGATAVFPFGWSQLNSDGGANVWAPGKTTPASTSDPTDPLGAWSSGFPSIRLAESSTLATPNTFQAVIIDTPVASGSVHSPYKQPAGARLARGALATAYAIPQPDPVVVSAATAGDSVTVTLGGLAGGTIETRTALGFEVLGADKNWHVTPITGTSNGTITIGSVPAGPSAIRYLWYSAPCGNAAPYQCPVYVKVQALGSLSGELDSLPLGPFIMKL